MEPVSLQALKRIAGLLGYDWTEEEIERLLPLVEKHLAALDQLDALPLDDVEPAVGWRIPSGTP